MVLDIYECPSDLLHHIGYPYWIFHHITCCNHYAINDHVSNTGTVSFHFYFFPIMYKSFMQVLVYVYTYLCVPLWSRNMSCWCTIELLKDMAWSIRPQSHSERCTLKYQHHMCSTHRTYSKDLQGRNLWLHLQSFHNSRLTAILLNPFDCNYK